MPQLLLELLSEEIPARMQQQAARDLERLVRERLLEAGLLPEAVQTYAGPRRLTLVAEGLPVAQTDRSEERKGPRANAPEQALAGFLRSTGLAREQLVERDGVFYATLHKPGRPTAEVIAEAVPAVVRAFPWPKSMRSGAGTVRWVRPLRRILCVFDGEVVAFEIDGVASGDLTQGHRFTGSRGAPQRARDFDAYAAALAREFVVLDPEERKARILDGARTLCFARGLELVDDAGLLEEVAGLAEWPTPVLGDMDPAFLDLPPEVIRTSMRTHQKYFAVRPVVPFEASTPSGSASRSDRLAPHFVTIANIEATDGGAEIARGNAKVLSARLSDARFFWEQDRAAGFDPWLEKLKGVTFHAKLGTLADRAARIEALAVELAPLVGADVDLTREAARLCKADLASSMVGEFPELQGVMGGYYARALGRSDAVADAVRDHYKPQGPSDAVPTAPVTVAVALADKLDTLVGFFAIDEKPTGSRDPYALRRAALGVIRIVLDGKVRLPLGLTAQDWIVRALQRDRGGLDLQETIYNIGQHVDEHNRGTKLVRFVESSLDLIYLGGQELELLRDFSAKSAPEADYDDDTADAIDELGRMGRRLQSASDAELRPYTMPVADAVLAFFADRLKVLLREQGRRHDLVDAVFALGDDDLVRIVARVEALSGFLATEDGANLLAGYRRAVNILKAEAKKGDLPEGAWADHPAAADEERALAVALAEAEGALTPALAAEDFAGAMSALARLRAPVDAFFDKVLVNAPEPEVRAARLRLLGQVQTAMNRVADFSLISGG